MDRIPRHEFNACVKRYGGDHRLRHFSCRDQFLCMAFVPAFIRISTGTMHEVRVLDELPIERGAFSVMDKAYIDFARLYRMHRQAAFSLRFSRPNRSAGGGSVPGLNSLHVRCAPSGVVRAVAAVSASAPASGSRAYHDSQNLLHILITDLALCASSHGRHNIFAPISAQRSLECSDCRVARAQILAEPGSPGSSERERGDGGWYREQAWWLVAPKLLAPAWSLQPDSRVRVFRPAR